MKAENYKKIESILTEELGQVVKPNDINYVLYKMNEVDFDSSPKIDKEELDKALSVAQKTLDNITLPIEAVISNAIYRNKVLIAITKVQMALL